MSSNLELRKRLSKQVDDDLYRSTPFGGRAYGRELYLSINDIRILEDEKAKAEILEKQQEEEDKAAEEGGHPKIVPMVTPAGKRRQTESEIDAEKLKEAAYISTINLDPQFNAPVYDELEPIELLNVGTKIADLEVNARARLIYDKLVAKGNFRKVGTPDFDFLEKNVAELKDKHPCFDEVIEFVFKHLLLARTKQQRIKIPPILLLGPPGLGKTLFSKDLAALLNTETHELAFDSSLSSSALMGSDKHWGNSSTGLVFESVVMGEYANPVIILDELDKAQSGQYQSPLSSLHSLLEPVSARNVKDVSLDFTFSAEHVIFIGIANYEQLIPQTIRSRFTVFHILPPLGIKAVMLAKSVAAACYESLGMGSFKRPTNDLVRMVSHLSPREQRKTWETAFAGAVAAGRMELTAGDLPEDEELETKATSKKTRKPMH